MDPFHVRTTASVFTTAQNDTLGHETDDRDWPEIRTGDDQAFPFHLIALPLSSTAMQNEALGHEMDF